MVWTNLKKQVLAYAFLGLFCAHAEAITTVTCEANDSDCDGYTEDGTGLGYDCDDTSYQMPAMPWTFDGCSSGQARKCNTGTGSYGSCTTPTEGSNNYYVDCDAGSDSNPCSFASQCGTFLKFSKYINTSEPSGYIGVAAGTTIWIKGSCTEVYSDSPDRPSFYQRDDGSSGNPWRAYSPLPSGNVGYSATFDVSGTCDGSPSCPAGALVGVNYAEVKGIRFTGGNHDGGTVDAEGAGIVWDDSNNIVFEANSVDNNVGDAGANPCGINGSNSPDNNVISHNTFYDNHDTAAGVAENERQVCLFNGTGNEFNYNRMQNTVARTDANDATGCFVWKHGGSGNSNEVAYNIIENCNYTGIGSGNSGTHIHHNLVLNSDTCAFTHNFGGSTYVRDNLIEYNTCVNTSGVPFMFHEPEVSGGAAGTTTYGHNIIVGNVASFSHYDSIFTVWPDDNTAWTTYNDGTLIESDNNCFDNTGAAALQFAGGSSNYTFAQWKALASNNYDQSSVEEVITFDSAYAVTSTNCAALGAGWRTAAGGGGGPSPLLLLNASGEN